MSSKDKYVSQYWRDIYTTMCIATLFIVSKNSNSKDVCQWMTMVKQTMAYFYSGNSQQLKRKWNLEILRKKHSEWFDLYLEIK